MVETWYRIKMNLLLSFSSDTSHQYASHSSLFPTSPHYSSYLTTPQIFSLFPTSLFTITHILPQFLRSHTILQMSADSSPSRHTRWLNTWATTYHTDATDHTDDDKPHGRRQTTRTKTNHTDEDKPHGRRQTTRTKTTHTDEDNPHGRWQTTRTTDKPHGPLTNHTDDDKPHGRRQTTRTTTNHTDDDKPHGRSQPTRTMTNHTDHEKPHGLWQTTRMKTNHTDDDKPHGRRRTEPHERRQTTWTTTNHTDDDKPHGRRQNTRTTTDQKCWNQSREKILSIVVAHLSAADFFLLQRNKENVPSRNYSI